MTREKMSIKVKDDVPSSTLEDAQTGEVEQGGNGRGLGIRLANWPVLIRLTIYLWITSCYFGQEALLFPSIHRERLKRAYYRAQSEV